MTTGINMVKPLPPAGYHRTPGHGQRLCDLDPDSEPYL